MKDRVVAAVYNPPEHGLPYLVVVVFLDGTINATPYDTLKEAEEWCQRNALDAAKQGR